MPSYSRRFAPPEFRANFGALIQPKKQMAEIIKMPKMSDTMTEGVIASWLKKVGDKVKSGDILAEVETDKATMELENYEDGTLLHIGPKEGESVPVDGLLAIVGKEGEDISALLNGSAPAPAAAEITGPESAPLVLATLWPEVDHACGQAIKSASVHQNREDTMRKFALAAALLLAGVAPGFGQDEAAIQELTDKWAAAFNEGDAAAVAALYTEDAYLLAPDMEITQGRDDIQKFWQGGIEQLSDMKLTVVDVELLGEKAMREIGTFTAKTKGDQPQEVSGKYVNIWEKVDDEWKLATDIYNVNK